MSAKKNKPKVRIAFILALALEKKQITMSELMQVLGSCNSDLNPKQKSAETDALDFRK